MLDTIKVGINNINAKDEKLMRAGGYTTNGYWCVQSKYEPKNLQKRNSTQDIEADTIKRMIDRALEGKFSELHVEKVEPLDNIDGNILVCVLQDDKQNEFIVNAYWIKWVLGMGEITLLGNTEYKYSPILAKQGEELVGLIMPMKINV